MPKDLILVVIDDDKQSSHDLAVQLKFLGEKPIMTTALACLETLKEAVQLDGKLAVILGACEQVSLAQLVKLIHDWDDKTPIIVTVKNKSLDQCHEKSRRLLYTLKSDLVDYRSLLTQLDKIKTQPPNSIISLNGTAMFRSLVGDSELMTSTRALMKKVADKMTNVLVLGESGTGKEIMARNLHYHSGRGDKPFVVVNCIAFNSERFTAELFGIEKGYNGAEECRAGFFEKANEGTLYLDEVSDIPVDIQGKILSFLEHQRFERLGGKTWLQSDVRIVASTNQNLQEKIAEGSFRANLFYRLNVVPIKMPALREHGEDLPELMIELLARMQGNGNNSIRFNSSAMQSLTRHSWPGNVRELTNLVERLSIVHPNQVIGLGDLPEEYQHINSHELLDSENSPYSSSLSIENQTASMASFSNLNEDSLIEYLANLEKQLLAVALQECEGANDFVAERLHLSEEQLIERIKLHGF